LVEVPNGGAVRLVDTARPAWWPQLNVDPGDRRTAVQGSPDALLRRLTSRPTYRSQAQKGAVRALVTQPPGSGLMASLPTGAGKSLLFQIAALHGRRSDAGACVAVITPTVALALDHERSLAAIPGLGGSRALTGDQAAAVRRETLDAFRRGKVPVLLLGPEAALHGDVAGYLAEAAMPDAANFGLDARLTHLFVDEAHIVESWGRGFRPDFQRLPGLLARLRAADPGLRLVLLSATLSQASRRVLRDGWSFGGAWLEVDARMPRYEHDVVVTAFGGDAERQEALDWVVDYVPRPAIVYTTEVAHARSVYDRLAGERGYRRIALFTGETTADRRRSIVDRWARDEIDVVVATSAFGMGVDKAGVRSVVHACLPEGAARWYQEIGRAARDGGQGVAALLFTDTGARDDDVARARSLATGGWLTRDLAERRWAAMIRDAREKGWTDGRFAMSVDLDSIREGLRPRSSDYNRNWNMALLTLLQRAGAVEIHSVSAGVDEVGQVWRVSLRENGLLDAAPAAWDRIFAERDREVQAARSELSPYLRLVKAPERACVTRGVFEIIEGTSLAPPCGRCPSCRMEGIQPPRSMPCGGLDAAWPEGAPGHCRLPAGPLLVQPRDPEFDRSLAGTLDALAGVGIEQFVVPDGLAARVADHLASTACRLGLVIAFGEWTSGNALARLPSGLLLPHTVADDAGLVRRFADWAVGGELPALVVAESSRVLAGRRADQWLSRFAPVSEDWLKTMVGGDGLE
jgi:ATP-dependent DNA helicase RecQ